MYLSKKITWYISREYVKVLLVTLMVLLIGFVLSNIFDNLSRFKSIEVSITQLTQLIFLKIPYFFNESMPLISFIATLLFLSQLAKTNQLISLFNGGISIWATLVPILSISGITGMIFVALISPIGSKMLNKYDLLEVALTNKRPLQFALTDRNIVLSEEYDNTKRVIIAKTLNLQQEKLLDVIILFLDLEHNFFGRIDAEMATFTRNALNLANPKFYTADPKIQLQDIIPTKLSPQDFVKGLIPPENISIWKMHESINKLNKLGIPSTKYQSYYYKQLFKPLFMIATAVMACCFIKIQQRNSNNFVKTAKSLIIGFITYSSLVVVSTIFHYNNYIYTNLSPILLITCMSIFIIAHVYE